MPIIAPLNRRQWLAGAAGAVLIGQAARAQSSASAVVETATGKLQGRAQGAVISFRGIPYGAAPGRFQRTRPVQWSGILEAEQFGAIAPQVEPPAGSAMSERCQFLNIWTPALDGKKRPVMFWCHGGAFTTGSAGQPRFDGAALASQQDVVVVTVNHRLGLLGALRLDHMDPDFTDSGCVGMLDIVDALRWVNQSIAAFGGDPDCVTIFGQSGGGGKVTTLLAMPEACRYFHRAIIQSGTVKQTSATPDQGLERTARLLRALSLQKGDIAGLREAPLERLLAAQDTLGEEPSAPAGMGPFAPMRAFAHVIDGIHLPDQPFGDHAPACSAHIPLIIGSTSEEMRAFTQNRPALFKLDMAGVAAALEPMLGARAPATLACYRAALPDLSPSDLFFALTGDEMYLAYSEEAALKKKAQGRGAIYMYRFAYDADRATRGETPTRGAGHGQENQYIFGNLAPTTSDDARRFSRLIGSSWAAFARTGNPNTTGLPHWSTFHDAQRRTMIFDQITSEHVDPYRARRSC
jgi:para-nitrobenzyl esterase